MKMEAGDFFLGLPAVFLPLRFASLILILVWASRSVTWGSVLFNLGLSEIVLITVIALIFIGPKQLPEIARAIGRALNELKRASEDLTTSITNPKNYTDSNSTPSSHKPTSHKPEETSSSSPDQSSRMDSSEPNIEKPTDNQGGDSKT